MTAGIKTTQAPRRDAGADDLARDAVTYWVDTSGAPPFDLDVPTRRALILELLDGYLSDDNERAILMILENSSDADILRIFDKPAITGGDKELSFMHLQSRFSGRQLEQLEAILGGLRVRFAVDPENLEDDELKATLKDRAIERDEVKAGIAASYRALAQKASGLAEAKDPTYPGEIAGLFMEVNGKIEHVSLPSTKATSEPDDVFKEARKKYGFNDVICSYHVHPNAYRAAALDPTLKFRDAPSEADIDNGVAGISRGPEHYVIDPWLVYLISNTVRLQVWMTPPATALPIEMPHGQCPVAIAKIPGGAVALTRNGWDTQSAFFFFSHQADPPYEPVAIKKLAQRIKGLVIEPDRSIVYATHDRIQRLRSNGAIELLYESRASWHIEFPYIVREPDGTLYLSVRDAIIRLSPTSSGYEEARLGPPSCPAVEPVPGNETECRCVDRPAP